MKNGMIRISHGTQDKTKVKSVAEAFVTPQTNKKERQHKPKLAENATLQLGKRMTLAEYSLIRQSEKDNIARAYLDTLNPHQEEPNDFGKMKPIRVFSQDLENSYPRAQSPHHPGGPIET